MGSCCGAENSQPLISKKEMAFPSPVNIDQLGSKADHSRPNKPESGEDSDDSLMNEELAK